MPLTTVLHLYLYKSVCPIRHKRPINTAYLEPLKVPFGNKFSALMASPLGKITPIYI